MAEDKKTTTQQPEPTDDRIWFVTVTAVVVGGPDPSLGAVDLTCGSDWPIICDVKAQRLVPASEAREQVRPRQNVVDLADTHAALVKAQLVAAGIEPVDGGEQ